MKCSNCGRRAFDISKLHERSLVDALFCNDRTERDYAAEIGISHQAVGKRKQKVVDKLRALMGVSIDSK